MEDGVSGFDVYTLLRAIESVRMASTQGGVLLHCRQGANRAPLFCIAYVSAVTGASVDRAIAHVRKCRAVTDIGGHGDDDKPWNRDVYSFLKAIEISLITMFAGHHDFLPEIVSGQVFKLRVETSLETNAASSLAQALPAPAGPAPGPPVTPAHEEMTSLKEEMHKLRGDLEAAHKKVSGAEESLAAAAED